MCSVLIMKSVIFLRKPQFLLHHNDGSLAYWGLPPPVLQRP